MNCRASVLAWLSTARHPLSPGRLAQRSGFARTSVAYALRVLVEQKHAERVGERGTYRFRITDAGRAALTP